MPLQRNEQFNDFSNTALTTRVDIVVRKIWYSNCKLKGDLFGQCSSRGLQLKARIKQKFAIKIVIIYSTLTNKLTIEKTDHRQTMTYYLLQSID